MRILIHALAALENGGSDTHLRGMVSTLGDISPETEYIIYINSTFHLTNVPSNAKVRSLNVKRLNQRVWFDQVSLPRIVKRERIDVIWATLYFGSLRPPVPQIMFQRNAMYYCDHYLKKLNVKEKMIIRLRRWLLYRIMLSSCYIVTPTLAMRDMILFKHPDVPNDRFEIIPHAFDHEPGEKDLPEAQSQLFSTSKSSFVKMLFVGHIMPWKGLFSLLDALAQVAEHTKEPFKLFLTIAREDWEKGFDQFIAKVSKLRLDNHIEILGKLRIDVMGTLYRNCDLLVYPSLCESFGFPLLEALAQGLPIVAADTAVNRELAGDGAVYYPSENIVETTNTLLKIIDDTALRTSLGKRGRLRFEKNHIQWAEYVRRLLELSQKAFRPKQKPESKNAAGVK